MSQRIVVLSDSHSSTDRFSQAMQNIEKAGIDTLLHCGDCFTDDFLAVCQKYQRITIWITRGNWDIDDTIAQQLEALPNVECQSYIQKNIEGVSFLAAHKESDAISHTQKSSPDIIFHGHTHRIRIEKKGGTLFLNPGALADDGFYFVIDFPQLILHKYHYTQSIT